MYKKNIFTYILNLKLWEVVDGETKMIAKKIKDKSGRIFYRHEFWEDCNNGLYNVGNCLDKSRQSRDLLSDSEIFWDVMCQMKMDWPYCFQYNMSNRTHNRQAWLGQASCSYNHNAEFNLTIIAWNELSDLERLVANNTADKMIDLFEKEEMGRAKTLFD